MAKPLAKSEKPARIMVLQEMITYNDRYSIDARTLPKKPKSKQYQLLQLPFEVNYQTAKAA